MIAYIHMVTGLNIVLGKAGVGKSYLINKLVSDCKKNAAVLNSHRLRGNEY